MLDDRLGDAGDVGFLEGVGADEVAARLAGDGDHGRRVHVGVGDAGDQVGRAGAAGGDADADLAGGAGIAVGHVGRALLVADQEMLQIRIVEGVVERDDHAAGQAEDDLDPGRLQRFDYHFRALQKTPIRLLALSGPVPVLFHDGASLGAVH